MRVGDILEILGAAAFAVAAYRQFGLTAAIVVAGLALIYEGQCYGAEPLPRPRLPRLLKRKKADGEPEPAEASA